MSMTKISICQQQELDSEAIKTEFNEDYPCHIYFVISRPRVTLIPEKCNFKGSDSKFVFRIQNKFENIEKEVLIKTRENTSNYKIKSEYPFSKFHIYDNGEKIFTAKSSLFYFMNTREYSDNMNSEILYIGQSYGKNGERQAPKRLKNHSTLQNIYSEAIQNNPDKEIWLALLSFERQLLTNFDGRLMENKNEVYEVEKAANIMYKFNENQLDEKQMINFTEAALIKYFKPKYNIIYKDIFPNPSHKSYKECYDLDVNSVAFQLETDTVKTKLFTKHIQPSFLNLGSFTLESREKRMSLFDMLDNEELPNTFGNIKIE
jgi:hypothetical protein